MTHTHRIDHVVDRWGLIVAVVLTALTLLLGMASWAGAQTIINPTGVAFVVSADHNTVVLGTPAVTRYELRFYVGGVLVPYTYDLGKPASPTIAEVTVMNPSIFAPLESNAYTAKIAAIGPSGEGLSDPTVPFGRIGPPRPATAPRPIP